MTIKENLNKLKNGNSRYVNDFLDKKLIDSSRRKSLVDGQNPFAIILSCADSRVVPEYVFNVGLGELFVIRVAGNIANRSTIASIEYAVTQLHVQLIIVLGHQDCMAVSAAISGGNNGENINHLLSHILPAITSKEDVSINDIVKNHAILTTNYLINKSETLKETHNNGSLKIVPAYYHLETGKVDFLN